MNEKAGWRGQCDHPLQGRLGRDGRLHGEPFVENKRVGAVTLVESGERGVGAVEPVMRQKAKGGEAIGEIAGRVEGGPKLGRVHAAAGGAKRHRGMGEGPAAGLVGVRR